MTETAITHTHRLSPVRRTAAALLLGAAVAALGAGAGRAETDAAATLDALTAPEPTGSIDSDAPAANVALPPEQPAPAAPAETSAPAPVEAAAPALAPLPAAIAALLAEQGPAVRLKITNDDRAALKAFYDARQGAPLWFGAGRFSPKADAAKARIAAAADDGLDPKRFRLPGRPISDDPQEIARAEVELSAAALAYAREAWGGRVDPNVISRNIASRPDPFDAGAALASLDASSDVAATLDGFNPPQPQFQALRKLLVEARGAQADKIERPEIAFGKLLRPGDEDPRVPALRARLGLAGADDDYLYDDALAAAVVNFQIDKKIESSGVVGRQTVGALNAGAERKDDAELIAINMERWRWMPRDLGATHVLVDLPAFRLHVVKDGQEVYETRVIIGKPTNQTPVLSSAINNIVVNPYWNVPVSIALKELSQGSLRGFEVVDSKGRVVPPGEIDWASVKAHKLRIRQPPGERNALGHIKFQFQNRFAVYLHDTPSRKLFGNDYRALSHGCVRVDQPLEFADALSGAQGLSGDKLQKMIGGKERGLPLTDPVPVHLTYFTAWVDADGKLDRRKDLYELDGRMAAALRGEQLSPPPVAPPPALPKIVRAKPRPAPEAQAAAVPPPQTRPSPSNWLSRLFGDSRY